MSLELDLTGKKAIVTGGSAGIGLATAKALYSEGVSVALVARDVDRLEKAVKTIQALPNQGNTVIAISADLTQSESIEKVVSQTRESFGQIDILINNAGSAKGGGFLELSEEDFIDAWRLKLLGYIRLIKAVAPELIQRRSGQIINIVGGAGRTPSANFLPGSTTNAALINFTRGLSKELARHNVRINVISPGFTDTDRAERLLTQNAQLRNISIETAKAEAIRSIPLNRIVQPQEIADLVLFLVSERAASIIGVEILVDGGQTPGI